MNDKVPHSREVLQEPFNSTLTEVLLYSMMTSSIVFRGANLSRRPMIDWPSTPTDDESARITYTTTLAFVSFSSTGRSVDT